MLALSAQDNVPSSAAVIQLSLFEFAKTDVETTRQCRRCHQHYPESLDYFYSAGHHNGKQYYKRNCIECEKQVRRDKYHHRQTETVLNQTAQRDQMLETVLYKSLQRVQVAWTAYCRARDFFNRGIVTEVAHRQLRLKQWLAAERNHRQVQADQRLLRQFQQSETVTR